MKNNLLLLSLLMLFSSTSYATALGCTVYGATGKTALVEFDLPASTVLNDMVDVSLKINTTGITTDSWFPSYGTQNFIRLTTSTDGVNNDGYIDQPVSATETQYTASNWPTSSNIFLTKVLARIETKSTTTEKIDYFGNHPLRGQTLTFSWKDSTLKPHNVTISPDFDGLYSTINSYWMLPDSIDFEQAGPGVVNRVVIPKTTDFNGTYSITLDSDSAAGSTISSPAGRVGPGETMTAENIDTDQVLELTRGDELGAIKGTARFTAHCG